MEFKLIALFTGIQDFHQVTDTISTVKEKDNLPVHITV